MNNYRDDQCNFGTFRMKPAISGQPQRRSMEEDLISNREMDLLLMPCWGDFDLNLIQWPPFLLASKLPIALDMAKDSKVKKRDRERELQKRLNTDGYMLCDVQECYDSCKNIFDFLILEIKHEASDKDKLVIMLLNMLEVVKKEIFDERDSSMMDPSRKYFAELNFPVTKETDAWKEKIRRLHLLLTEKESAMDVPSNLEARRRISFFSNYLFMDMQ
ncbi:callose synthase 2-like protein [Tanacetum coccineum]